MSAREEELITRLLEEERRRRVERIVETGKINPEDALVVATLDLNRRVGRIETIMATKDDIRNMATKDDIRNMATKQDLADVLTKDDLQYLATKDDIRNMATKQDLADVLTKDDLQYLATKDDLKAITGSIEAIKDSIRNMRYWLTFAFTILFFGLPVMIGLVMKLFGK